MRKHRREHKPKPTRKHNSWRCSGKHKHKRSTHTLRLKHKHKPTPRHEQQPQPQRNRVCLLVLQVPTVSVVPSLPPCNSSSNHHHFHDNRSKGKDLLHLNHPNSNGGSNSHQSLRLLKDSVRLRPSRAHRPLSVSRLGSRLHGCNPWHRSTL